MMDPDLMTIAALLFAVVAILLIPPGPGTPLHEAVKAR
jgi:hypothetical protein